MPYASEKQRALIHAKAHEGVLWAMKFAHEADRMPQPKHQYVPRSKLAREAEKKRS